MISNDNDTKLQILNISYPIGAIFISVSSINPREYFGGEWEQIQDTFLLACGSKHAGGDEGGEESHTLTTDEMPRHKHNNIINVTAEQSEHTHAVYSGKNKCTMSAGLGYDWCNGIGGPDNDVSDHTYMENKKVGEKTIDFLKPQQPSIHVTHKIDNAEAGSCMEHNNMPPYLAVYMWKRIR